MIFGNKNNLAEFDFLNENIKRCFAYADDHDLLSYERGSYEIDKKKLFVNIAEYTTADVKSRFWEAHKRYLDIHLMLRGSERIDLNFIRNLEQGTFIADEDFLPLEGEANASVILKEGDFLICYPNDGHRTAVQANDVPETIKKAIFKVKI